MYFANYNYTLKDSEKNLKGFLKYLSKILHHIRTTYLFVILDCIMNTLSFVYAFFVFPGKIAVKNYAIHVYPKYFYYVVRF